MREKHPCLTQERMKWMNLGGVESNKIERDEQGLKKNLENEGNSVGIRTDTWVAFSVWITGHLPLNLITTNLFKLILLFFFIFFYLDFSLISFWLYFWMLLYGYTYNNNILLHHHQCDLRDNSYLCYLVIHIST